MAVVGGLNLDQPVAAGEAASDAHGVERGLGPRVGEPPLGLVETALQLVCNHDHVLDRLREVGAALDLGLHGGDDLGMGVADDHDTKPVVEIDVLVAVDVPHPAAFSAVDKDGLRRRVLE